jgi:hypothetical protein
MNMKTRKRVERLAGDGQDWFGYLKDEIEIVGDTLFPLVKLDDWDVLR